MTPLEALRSTHDALIARAADSSAGIELAPPGDPERIIKAAQAVAYSIAARDIAEALSAVGF